MRCYALVLASMYRYSWLITFEIFLNFFFFDKGVGGWGVSYPNFFWIYIYFFIFTRPISGRLISMQSTKIRTVSIQVPSRFLNINQSDNGTGC